MFNFFGLRIGTRKSLDNHVRAKVEHFDEVIKEVTAQREHFRQELQTADQTSGMAKEYIDYLRELYRLTIEHSQFRSPNTGRLVKDTANATMIEWLEEEAAKNVALSENALKFRKGVFGGLKHAKPVKA